MLSLTKFLNGFYPISGLFWLQVYYRSYTYGDIPAAVADTEWGTKICWIESETFEVVEAVAVRNRSAEWPNEAEFVCIVVFLVFIRCRAPDASAVFFTFLPRFVYDGRQENGIAVGPGDYVSFVSVYFCPAPFTKVHKFSNFAFGRHTPRLSPLYTCNVAWCSANIIKFHSHSLTFPPFLDLRGGLSPKVVIAIVARKFCSHIACCPLYAQAQVYILVPVQIPCPSPPGHAANEPCNEMNNIANSSNNLFVVFMINMCWDIDVYNVVFR